MNPQTIETVNLTIGCGILGLIGGFLISIPSMNNSKTIIIATTVIAATLGYINSFS